MNKGGREGIMGMEQNREGGPEGGRGLGRDQPNLVARAR